MFNQHHDWVGQRPVSLLLQSPVPQCAPCGLSHVHALFICSLCQDFSAPALLMFWAEQFFFFSARCSSVLYMMCSSLPGLYLPDAWQLFLLSPTSWQSNVLRQICPQIENHQSGPTKIFRHGTWLPRERGSSQWFQGLGPDVPDHYFCHILSIKVGHIAIQTEGEGK